MNAVRLIHQDSGQAEWWTPQPILEAARVVMGGIDLDPASSAEANERVGAVKFYDEPADGLSLARPWAGRVWLNPPFADTSRFIAKLMAEYDAGRVREACVITFASLDTAWARQLLRFARWYPAGRVAYVAGWRRVGSVQSALPGLAGAATVDLVACAAAPDAPPKASMVTYVGPDGAIDWFAHQFTGRLGGAVDVPYETHRQLLRDLAAREGR